MTVALLTGATGMVGRELLARLVSDDRFERVACLVRAKKGQTAQQRVDGLLKWAGLTPTPRAVAVEGDVELPQLGLSASDRALLSQATHVVHAAGSVAFDEPLARARAINVAGTQEVIGFARSLPALKRIDVLSTAYVCGLSEGLFSEAALEHPHGFRNTYEQSKYESELLVRAQMRDVPMAVHRPSIVVGDSRSGRAGSFKVLYWPLKVVARGWLPFVTYNPPGRLDIVPVDFVADSVLALSRDDATLGKTFHLAAGPNRDATVEQVALAAFRLLGRKLPPHVSWPTFRKWIQPALHLIPTAQMRSMARTVDTYVPYFELNVRFGTEASDAFLAKAGLTCPNVSNYLESTIATAFATDFGNRPAP